MPSVTEFSQSDFPSLFPSEENVKSCSTNNIVKQENGQRKWGPPLDWTGPPPTRGCEIFIGKLPRNLTEEDLLPVFSRVGRVYEMRLMVDFSGQNRGFCFLTFGAKDEAKQACQEMNNLEIRPGQHIGVVMSVDNCRLFVGGIPRERSRNEVLAEMTKLTEGVKDVILYPSANDKSKNRGFAFVEYSSHKEAAMARRKLYPGKMQLWGQPICVDWAEPEQEVDDKTMSQVKILYVRNLMLSTTEESIRKHFEQFKSGSVEKVKKLKDFGFVHFYERKDALHAMNQLNGSTLDRAELEVVWAKPPDRSLMRYVKNVQKQGGQSPTPWSNGGNVHQNIVAEATRLYTAASNGSTAQNRDGLGGTITGVGDSLTSESIWAYTGSPLIDSGFQHAMNIANDRFGGRGVGNYAGNNRVNYRGAAGMRGAGFQAFVNNQVRKSRRRFSEAALMSEFFPYPPGMTMPTTYSPTPMSAPQGLVWVALAPSSPLMSPTIAPSSPLLPPPSPLLLPPTHQLLHPTTFLSSPTKPSRPAEQLEDICAKHPQLGVPQYDTNVIATKDGYGRDIHFYICKVFLPGLRDRYPCGFQPDKPSTDEEAAKDLAALFALLQLGFSPQTSTTTTVPTSHGATITSIDATAPQQMSFPGIVPPTIPTHADWA